MLPKIHWDAVHFLVASAGFQTADIKGLFRHRTCPDILSNPVCCTTRQSKEDTNISKQAANCTASALSGKSQAQRGAMINDASPNAILNA